MFIQKIKDFFFKRLYENDNRITNETCIYCKNKIKTCNYPPICSRKSCKKMRVK